MKVIKKIRALPGLLVGLVIVLVAALAGCEGDSQIVQPTESSRPAPEHNGHGATKDAVRIRPGSPEFAPSLKYYEVELPNGDVIPCLQSFTPGVGNGGGAMSCAWDHPVNMHSPAR